MLNLLVVFCFVLKPVLELIIMYITNYSSLFPMSITLELILLSLYLYTEKHMKIQGKQLYVSMQCTCIDISMAELRESGESMQFLKVIEPMIVMKLCLETANGGLGVQVV
jgi:hypothetical protein